MDYLLFFIILVFCIFITFLALLFYIFNKLNNSIKTVSNQQEEIKELQNRNNVVVYKDIITKNLNNNIAPLNETLINNNLEDITNITFFDKDTKTELLNFKKIDLKDISKYKYKEIKLNGALSSSVIGKSIVPTTISALNSKGLFTASVNPGTLIQYAKDGSFSSMVKGINGIQEHSGFLSASKSVFAPIIVFQVLSFVTSQYYLNGITKQLATISNRIEDLQFFIESEDFATIKVIQDEFSLLINKNIIEKQDFYKLSNFEISLKQIKEKYKINLERELDKIKHIDEDEIEGLEEIKNKINKYSNVFYNSQQLLFYSYMIKFVLDIKSNNLKYIDESYKKILNYDVEQISFEKVLQKITKLQKEIGDPWFGNKDEIIKKLKNKFKMLQEKNIKQIDEFEKGIKNTKTDINNQMNGTQDILCYIDENNNQKIFIKDSNQ